MSPGSVVQSSPEPSLTFTARVGGDGGRFFSVRRSGVTGNGSGGKPSPPLILWGRAGGGGPQLLPKVAPGHIRNGAAFPRRFKNRRREMCLLIASPFPLRLCASAFRAPRLFNAETRSAWSVSLHVPCRAGTCGLFLENTSRPKHSIPPPDRQKCAQIPRDRSPLEMFMGELISVASQAPVTTCSLITATISA